jgi:cytochrome P450
MPDSWGTGSWPFPLDDPYPAYAAARRQSPVTWNDGLDAWLVLDHEHCRAVLTDDVYSADPSGNPRLFERLGGNDPGGALLSKVLLFTDHAEHDRLRRTVSRWFTPRQVGGLQDRVAELVASAWPKPGGGPVEIMSELARPLPLAVIAELLDVGADAATVIFGEAHALTASLDPLADEHDRRRAADAGLAISLVLIPVIADRRAKPGNDLTSALLEVLEPAEVTVMALLLLAAGHVTTANLIATAFTALAGDGATLALLRDHPEQVGPAVDEILRWESPAQLVARVATRLSELGGHRVRRGDLVVAVIGAANRDPAVYDDPDRLQVLRFAGQPRPPASLAFGWGPHACIGGALARTEAAEVVRCLANGGPWRLDAWERAPFTTFRGFTTLTATAAST